MNKLAGVVLLLALLFVCMAFAKADAAESGKSGHFNYMVVKGDNPWKLARKFFGHGTANPAIVDLNRIKDVYRIQIGTVLKIPFVAKIVKANGKAVSYQLRRQNKSSGTEIRKPRQSSKAAVQHAEAKPAKTVADHVIEESVVGDKEDLKAGTEKTPRDEKITSDTYKESDPIKTSEAPKADSQIAVEHETVTTDKTSTDINKPSKESEPTKTSETPKAGLQTAEIKTENPAAAETKAEPLKNITKSELDFTDADVMPADAPVAKAGHEDHAQNGIEHQVSLNADYSNNKADKMKGLMLDYNAWLPVPSLGPDSSLGLGALANYWQDNTANERIRGVMPGLQISYKYNRHTDDHLMRMFRATLMGGYEFQNVKSKYQSSGSSVSAVSADPMASDPMSPDPMPTTDTMAADPMPENSSMPDVMSIKAKNSFKIGSMLEYHHQLNPKSTLELMNVNWYALRKQDMSMDPNFSLTASHVYSFDDWNWRVSLGPQYEGWSDTWRLHVVPAELQYKNWVTVGLYGNLYPWKKGEMYKDFSRHDLSAFGVNLRFSIGADMHQGHYPNDR